jgi:hypothetical protein
MTLSLPAPQHRPSAAIDPPPGHASPAPRSPASLAYDGTMPDVSRAFVPLVAAVAVSLAACGRAPLDGVAARFVPFESRCASLPDASFEVAVAPVDVREDFSLPYGELARMGVPSSPRHSTVGLTRASFGYRSTLELDGLEDTRAGRVCARARVRVEVSAAPMTVYVAREYAGDACREPLILEHERRHVEVFTAYAAEIAPALARGLEASIGNRLTYGSTMAGAQAAIKEALDAELGVFLAQASDELARRNAAIDTPDEYERLARECGPTR